MSRAEWLDRWSLPAGPIAPQPYPPVMLWDGRCSEHCHCQEGIDVQAELIRLFGYGILDTLPEARETVGA